MHFVVGPNPCMHDHPRAFAKVSIDFELVKW